MEPKLHATTQAKATKTKLSRPQTARPLATKRRKLVEEEEKEPNKENVILRKRTTREKRVPPSDRPQVPSTAVPSARPLKMAADLTRESVTESPAEEVKVRKVPKKEIRERNSKLPSWNLTRLSKWVHMTILTYLWPEDIFAYASISRRMKESSEHECIWREIAQSVSVSFADL